MTRLLFLVLTLFASVSAHADFVWTTVALQAKDGNGVGSSRDASCRNMVSKYVNSGFDAVFTGVSIAGTNGGLCQGTFNYKSNGTTYSSWETAINRSGTCDAPSYEDASGECIAPVTTTTTTTTTSTLPPCPPGESRRLGVCMPQPCPDGQHQEAVLTVTPTGTYFPLKCIADTDPNQSSGEGTCPDGKPSVNGGCAIPQQENPCPPGYIMINANPADPVCTQKPKTNTEVKEEVLPDGTKKQTTTEKTISKNPDGSTSTNEKTTTTTTNPDGSKSVSVSTSAGKQEQGDDMCAKHPELTICKNSSVSGSCAAVTCTGDAIQCEILKKASERACIDKAAEDAIKDSSQKQLGENVSNGSDPLAGSLPKPGNATNKDLGSMNSTGWLGGGSCFTDKSFTLQGKTIVIPFSKACDYLIVFRYVLMILASLFSYRMLSGTFLRD